MMPQKPTIINMQQLYREVKGKWNSLYPIYFNSNKSLSQGRRVSKQLAIEEPTLQQISYACGQLYIKNIIEPHKAYSRDFLERGRLKVQLFNKDDQPINANIKSKKVFLNQVGQKLKENRAKMHKK